MPIDPDCEAQYAYLLVRYRRAWVMYLRGMKRQQIAMRFGCSVRTVSNYLAAARRQIAEYEDSKAIA